MTMNVIYLRRLCNPSDIQSGLGHCEVLQQLTAHLDTLACIDDVLGARPDSDCMQAAINKTSIGLNLIIL